MKIPSQLLQQSVPNSQPESIEIFKILVQQKHNYTHIIINLGNQTKY